MFIIFFIEYQVRYNKLTWNQKLFETLHCITYEYRRRDRRYGDVSDDMLNYSNPVSWWLDYLEVSLIPVDIDGCSVKFLLWL